MALHNILEVVQIAFYIVAMIVAVATYRAAKQGWLSPINTEYHKRTMDRIQDILGRLFEEFDYHSEKFMQRVKAQSIDALRTEPLLPFGTRPFTEHEMYLRKLESECNSDPFLPESIRGWLLDYVRYNRGAYVKAYDDAFEKCGFGVIDISVPKPSDQEQTSRAYFVIQEALEQQHASSEQRLEALTKVRTQIQHYFAKFDPSTKRNG